MSVQPDIFIQFRNPNPSPRTDFLIIPQTSKILAISRIWVRIKEDLGEDFWGRDKKGHRKDNWAETMEHEGEIRGDLNQ